MKKIEPTRDDREQLFAPFWEGTVTHGEGLFFIRYSEGEPPKSSLLFPAKKLIKMEQPGSGLLLEQGRDFVIGPDRKTLYLTDNSRIPFKNYQDLFPLPNAPHSYPAARDGVHHLLWMEGHDFHDLQVEATYTHSKDAWIKSGGRMPETGEKCLPRTLQKLKNHEPLKICLLGDSISCGCNASGMTGTRPFMPFYGELVANHLGQKYGSEILFKNFSVGGQTSVWGVAEILKIVPEKPDLAIIAFGMNDASWKVPAEEFASNIKKQIEIVRNSSPGAEFILVATMSGNPNWNLYSEEHYKGYRDALYKINGEGIAVADVTSVWMEMLRHKTFYDITGNGINHPNDFGHRVYAHVILKLFE